MSKMNWTEERRREYEKERHREYEAERFLRELKQVVQDRMIGADKRMLIVNPPQKLVSKLMGLEEKIDDAIQEIADKVNSYYDAARALVGQDGTWFVGGDADRKQIDKLWIAKAEFYDEDDFDPDEWTGMLSRWNTAPAESVSGIRSDHAERRERKRDLAELRARRLELAQLRQRADAEDARVSAHRAEREAMREKLLELKMRSRR